MKKIALLLLLTAIVGLRSFAVPAFPGLIPVPQPDGTMLSIKLVGDEYYHFNTTADGYTITLNDAGGYVYVQRDGDTLVPTQVLAHNEGERSLVELSLLANTPKRLTDREEVAQANIRRAPSKVGLPNFDYDKFRGLVVLIDFSDLKFSSSDPQAFYSEMFNTEGMTSYFDAVTGRNVNCLGSVRDYFRDQSNGIFNPPFDVCGPYPATFQNVQAKATQCQTHSTSIFTNALKKANDEVDFTRYDNNNDGKVDMVFFLVAGYSSAQGNNEGYLWPHESSLYYSYLTLDGKRIDLYASSTELYGLETSPSSVTIEGIGTACHEFSHVLGLPDFYDTDYEKGGGQSHDPGDWDIMSGGSYFNYGRSPVGYTFFERYALGWAEPVTITKPGQYTLNPVNTSREGYILRTPVANEFFTIENRQKNGWDAYVPGHGMIVTRVDSTNASIWSQNKVNCNPEHNYFEMLRAGNSNSGSKSSDPFPGTTGNIMITNETNPNLTTWGGYANYFNITGISEQDGVIRFNVIEDGTMLSFVEDFEDMPASTGTTDANVEGAFASWTFNKAGVRAPGSDKANGEHSVMMKLPSQFYSVTPIAANIYMASMVVFNPSSTIAKYTLEYSLRNDEEGNPIWITAPSSKGEDMAEVAAKTNGMCYWLLDLNDRQPATFRIYQKGGNKNTATYVDDLTFYYTEGGYVLPGDVDENGEINIADINLIIAVIVGDKVSDRVKTLADVDGNKEVNIADVNAIINVILY